jgi:chromosome segregation protein
VHLKSLTLKGFKSFPDRTRLDFGPGVSVVVGPNGSGKSNVTDAVLWAMGEQSPLAVRGQSMQDVIFGGGRGVQPRSAAEVEIVLDNSDGTVDLPLSEISIVRRLDRTGEGGYRLNGARCRLTDVIEVLSDTGLGKETHSVISQGRVEAIVTSKPRERRLLIEEAAGLGKHRKRRRRAQLKLEHTQENLDRALDIEREARTRLRPLKRQAEAAELHERLERQMLQARRELAREALRAARAELEGAERGATQARAARAELDAQVQGVAERRGASERALTERSDHHDMLTGRVYAARGARERVQLRAEQAQASLQALARRVERAELELRALGEVQGTGEAAPAGKARAGGGRGKSAAAKASSPDGRATGGGDFWSHTWERVRRVIADGVERALAQTDERQRRTAVADAVAEAERLARTAVERALVEAQPLAVDADKELGEASHAPEAASARTRRAERLQARREADLATSASAQRLCEALGGAAASIDAQIERFDRELSEDKAADELLTAELRACASEEAELQAKLRAAGEAVTVAEVAAQRVRDQAAEAELEVKDLAERLGPSDAPAQDPSDLAPAQDPTDVAQVEPLGEEEARALTTRLERLARRRAQLGPVNPLAQEEYAQALAHVEELEGRRTDLETALRELRAVIRDTDRQIEHTFQETFAAAARNFGELVGDLFPGGSGRLRLVRDEQVPRPVLGGQPLPAGERDERSGAAAAAAEGEAASTGGEADAVEHAAQEEADGEEHAGEELLGVEIEITPAGKATKRLSLLSGGEKSMTAIAFLFAVFLARPCPFYILDEVEAALDDLNLDRFLALLRRYSDRAQFIVITHQKRTMEAADWLYGVSMGDDGVSKVLSRRLPPAEEARPPVAEVA